MSESLREWMRVSGRHVVGLGPVMVIAGFASGLAIQFISPSLVNSYLGNTLLAIVIAATVGILINVPLNFKIPSVVLLPLIGMGEAPVAYNSFAWCEIETLAN